MEATLCLEEELNGAVEEELESDFGSESTDVSVKLIKYVRKRTWEEATEDDMESFDSQRTVGMKG
jgi:hypothetical protein